MNKLLSKILIALIISPLIWMLLAQQNSFKVLTISGKVSYKNSSSSTWKTLRTGEVLKMEDELLLEKNGYLVLMSSHGKTIEVLDEGTSRVREIESRLNNSQTSLGKKFTDFIVQEMMTNKSEKKEMKTFAAVVRVKPNHIESGIPAFTAFSETEILIKWYTYPYSSKYVLSIINSDKAAIFMDITEDTVYSFDSEKLKLNKGKLYYWYVFDADNPEVVSDTNSFSLLTEQEKNAISDSVELLNNELTSNRTPLNQFALGKYYENNNLNNDALDQYKSAILLIPESEELKKVFAKFLIKQKLYTLVSELLKDEDTD
ncbi:MAG: hypothetical protein HXY50_09720 [Ignavibacteriaceae bacterium]|nr:hypothetical protein [Ignavibacteriaceae bacterium]